MRDLKCFEHHSIAELLSLRMQARRDNEIATALDITLALHKRNYYEEPKPCTCREIAGDDELCPIHARPK